MRDFLPEEMNMREELFDKIRAIFRSYGYEPLETPALEELEILTLKCGEDTNKQIFRVEEKLGLRFDLTVPLARVMASRLDIPKPFKRYCISRVWRREEPQKGRYREFWQADIDIIGSSHIGAEAELVACASECLRAVGIDKFNVRINDRRILEAAFLEMGVEKGKLLDAFRAIDKLEKIGVEGVRKELATHSISETHIEKIIRFISISGTNDEKLRKAREFLEKQGGGKHLDGIKELLRLISTYGYGDFITVDFSLARGLDYYTGTVFEISCSGGAGSIGGGGRYDGLIGAYGGVQMPAVGISLGVERIFDILKKESLAKRTRVLLYIAPVSAELYNAGILIAQKFRSMHVPCEIDLMGRPLKKQFEYANARGIPFVAVVGDREIKENMITLRSLETGEEKKVSTEDAAKIILQNSGIP